MFEILFIISMIPVVLALAMFMLVALVLGGDTTYA